MRIVKSPQLPNLMAPASGEKNQVEQLSLCLLLLIRFLLYHFTLLPKLFKSV